jgi:hypothetical protein
VVLFVAGSPSAVSRYSDRCWKAREYRRWKAIQDLLDELEASKQSRSRAWSVLQRVRIVLSELGSVAIPPPAQKTFEAEEKRWNAL